MRRRSQSPSLRGSGRFVARPTRRKAGGASLNPLHCGAVVASVWRWGEGPPGVAPVSIPFIAGQWSLRVEAEARAQRAQVSIPFIAGQWSLHIRDQLQKKLVKVSQSPSLRGSGRFLLFYRGRNADRRSQSPSLRGSGRFDPRFPILSMTFLLSQSPSLRGSGRFLAQQLDSMSEWNRSQSPSLRGSGRFNYQLDVIASFRSGLNPLHCGAVVASPAMAPGPSSWRVRVSIPFIAGQWSLQLEALARNRADAESQSPSLRGSGRFHVSTEYGADYIIRSQSPSLRGSGRFRSTSDGSMKQEAGLNPLHCGAVVASGGARRRRHARRVVSIPFIAGQWSLPESAPHPGPGPPRLNPLHCGAVVASELRALAASSPNRLNPLHCGAVVASRAEGSGAAMREASQSPSLRGSGRFRRRRSSSGCETL